MRVPGDEHVLDVGAASPCRFGFVLVGMGMFEMIMSYGKQCLPLVVKWCALSFVAPCSHVRLVWGQLRSERVSNTALTGRQGWTWRWASRWLLWLLFVVFLTLTDPLRIQPWSQDRRNQTKSNRESKISTESRQKRTDKKVASKGHRRDKIENTNKNAQTVETNSKQPHKNAGKVAL